MLSIVMLNLIVLNVVEPIQPLFRFAACLCPLQFRSHDSKHLFAFASGANPMWDPDADPVAPRAGYLTDLDMHQGKMNSLYRNDDDDDNASMSSGDSVLIGVENQADFRGYKDRVRS